MPRWAKISDAIAEDITVADMLSTAKESRALALFLMSLPRADAYGVLPGEPRLFKARVCPAAQLSEGRIVEVINILEQQRLVVPFENDSGSHLYIRNYHRYQEIRWDRVGVPEIVMPEDWPPPPALIAWLSDQDKQKQEQFGAYIPALSRLLLDQSRIVPEHSRLDVDVDVDSDTDIDKTTPSVDSYTPESPPPAKERKLNKHQRVILAAWEMFGFDGQPGEKDTGKAVGYSSLMKLVQQHGIPKVKEWIKAVGQTPLALPEGAEQWVWFKEQFRAAMNRPWEWQPETNKKPRKTRSAGPAIQGEGGVVKKW